MCVCRVREGGVFMVLYAVYMQESKIGCSAEDRMNIKVITINIFVFLINKETHN